MALTALTGDASTRRFFRLRLEDGRTLVAMVLEGPIDPATHPQIVVGDYLASLGLPIPRLEAAVTEAGLLLYEDLGDLLLQEEVERGTGFENGDELERLYRGALDMLGILQDEGTRRLPPGHPSAISALDEERFGFELNFFREHYIDHLRARHGITLKEQDLRVLKEFLGSLAAEAAAPPWVLCHRDFHSRNLLVQDGRLRLVDFQDARMGPPAYDLASLLRDSYVVLPESFRERLLHAFMEMRREAFPDPDSFRRSFHVVSLQRNLKAIGTFAYQAVVRKKDFYLAYIPPTWSYVFETLERLPEWAAVVPVLEAVATL